MRIDITKGTSDDAIAIERADGTRALTRFPKKGPLPHDGVHAIVERALGFRRAFWGHVAGGRHPEDIARLAAEAGHPSAKRAGDPDASIVEMIQAERLVECFEAEIWGGPAALDVLQSVADAAMGQSRVPCVPLSPAAVARIRSDLAAFAAAWRALRVGEIYSFDWTE
ncbi:MAG: hypothetical protein A3E78_10235 [Alphaproteobacteria bacterium RIFCSPHIGHO2_12_FULL_63_12]|nr:MAG: hypothetical protein A3E78_10235 [Alphaproteobacteria bacterium RIFCSPHIGHO2_12_FULL_63_12]